MKNVSILILCLFCFQSITRAQVIDNKMKKPTVMQAGVNTSKMNPNTMPVFEIGVGENRLKAGDGVRFTGRKPSYTIHIDSVSITAGEGLEITGKYPNYKVEYKKHYVGEEYLGGVIFYVDETGHHGLVAGEVSSGSWTTYNWEYFKRTEKIAGYTVDEEEARITAGDFKTLNNWLDGIGAGKYNTHNMITNDQIDLNVVDVGEPFSITYYLADKFPNWYIPSHYELQLLYKQRHTISQLPKTGVYWSSTESKGKVKRYKQNGPRGENLNRKYLEGYSNVKVDLGENGVNGVKCIDFTNGLTVTVAKTYNHNCILIREF